MNKNICRSLGKKLLGNIVKFFRFDGIFYVFSVLDFIWF